MPPTPLDLGYALAGLLAAPLWMRKARGDWPARFGRGEPLPPPRGPRVLIHAVSVGEVNALRTLVPDLASRCEVVLSVGTDTGIERARALFGGTSAVVRYPLDFSWSVRRFLDRVRPDAVLLVELELWPQFVRGCARRGVPVGVINGRLSERSFRGYRRVRWALAPTFGRLAFAAVQDEDYAQRFEAMGVPPERVLISGSMKWDAARIEDDAPGAAALAEAMGIDRARPLVVAGSTGPGEEALLHAAVGGRAQLLCAPRRPERFDEAAEALPGCVRRSTGGRGPAERYLLDTIGELRAAYALADVVVVGRSFFDLHGSDPIEPVALGRATVIGPAVGDFARVVEALEGGGGLARADRESVGRVVGALLEDPARRRALAEAGRGAIRARQGASARHAALALGLVGVGHRAGGRPGSGLAPSTAEFPDAEFEGPGLPSSLRGPAEGGPGTRERDAQGA